MNTAVAGATEASILFRQFLRAMNAADYDEIAKVVAADFEDHHPGFEIHGIETYLAALKGAHTALNLQAELVEILSIGDKVIVRCLLTGEHVGEIMGFAPTGKKVTWTTTEIWRCAHGQLVERWAEDDLLGLRAQLSPDADNVQLVRRLNDAVNEHRYDDFDALFAPGFVDHNPAWDVADLDQLKGIIQAAHDALDFHVEIVDLYPAEGGKVVFHIVFHGRHVGPFFGVEPTGKPVTWTSTEVYRMENNLIVERWTQADTTGLMRQIGVPLP
jgi:predicted ester cyclase